MATKATSTATPEQTTTKRQNGTTVTLEPVVKDGRVVDTKRTVKRKDGGVVRVRTRRGA